MTVLNKQQLRAAAAASRELAMECVNGTAPGFGVGAEFVEDGRPWCASGHVAARAGLRRRDSYALGSPIYDSLPKSVEGRDPWWIVTAANDHASDHVDRQERLVFPLLALADELENAAQRPPETTPADEETYGND